MFNNEHPCVIVINDFIMIKALFVAYIMLKLLGFTTKPLKLKLHVRVIVTIGNNLLGLALFLLFVLVGGKGTESSQ